MITMARDITDITKTWDRNLEQSILEERRLIRNEILIERLQAVRFSKERIHWTVV